MPDLDPGKGDELVTVRRAALSRLIYQQRVQWAVAAAAGVLLLFSLVLNIGAYVTITEQQDAQRTSDCRDRIAAAFDESVADVITLAVLETDPPDAIVQAADRATRVARLRQLGDPCVAEDRVPPPLLVPDP